MPRSVVLCGGGSAIGPASPRLPSRMLEESHQRHDGHSPGENPGRVPAARNLWCAAFWIVSPRPCSSPPHRHGCLYARACTAASEWRPFSARPLPPVNLPCPPVPRHPTPHRTAPAARSVPPASVRLLELCLSSPSTRCNPTSTRCGDVSQNVSRVSCAQGPQPSTARSIIRVRYSRTQALIGKGALKVVPKTAIRFARFEWSIEEENCLG